MPQQKLEPTGVPQTAEQANQLSIELNTKYGSRGWNLAGVVAVGNSASLLFAFEKPDTDE